MLFLSRPSPHYKHSHLDAIREFREVDHRQMSDEGLAGIEANFSVYVQRLLDWEDATKIPPEWVTTSVYWLVDDELEGAKQVPDDGEGVYIGRLNVRHELTKSRYEFSGHIGYEIRPSMRQHGYGKEILRLGLEKARERGLHHVLVTCDETNIGSKKIIEANGGRFQNAVTQEGSPVKKLRYWITLHS